MTDLPSGWSLRPAEQARRIVDHCQAGGRLPRNLEPRAKLNPVRVKLPPEKGMEHVLRQAGCNFRLDPCRQMRAGGGLGYSAPPPFLEEAEARSYRGVGPVPDGFSAEKSVGWNVDLNYRAVAGPIVVTLNQAVYSTRLNNSLVPQEVGGSVSFVNGAGSVLARGSETTARISHGDVALFLGYVYLEVDREEGGITVPVPFTARHRTYSVLVWEQHGKDRIGLEAYYTGTQTLTGGEESPGYLITGIMAQRRFGDVTVFANLENMLDARQSRTSPLVTGPRDSPTFPGIWGPTDGFIVNAGFILAF
jgi:outer membrane receptor for ferrienterochelin and colicins